MVKVLIGNLFESEATTLVNTVNTVGIMGKGIAQEFKKRFPAMFEDYERQCSMGQVKPGVPYHYKDMLRNSVINFPTKEHWRSPSRIQDIISGLDVFLENYKSWGIESVAFPPLGGGNGGLEWSLVGPVMYQKLSGLDIPVEIYAPFGTPSQQLTPAFLQRPVEIKNSMKGGKNGKLNPSWIAILSVMDQLGRQPYAKPVGRTIFQKICYILTEQGVDTNFHFRQGSYGPFSSEVKDALNVFANMNLLQEEQLGKMNALIVGPEFEKVYKKHEDELKPLTKKINKTVDLFSRIKSTEQAEEVATVLYAARHIKQGKVAEEVTEQDLFDYIVDWKKNWQKTDKKESIASTIRNLEMLDWLRLQYSESLPAPTSQEPSQNSC